MSAKRKQEKYGPDGKRRRIAEKHTEKKTRREKGGSKGRGERVLSAEIIDEEEAGNQAKEKQSTHTHIPQEEREGKE